MYGPILTIFWWELSHVSCFHVIINIVDVDKVKCVDGIQNNLMWGVGVALVWDYIGSNVLIRHIENVMYPNWFKIDL